MEITAGNPELNNGLADRKGKNHMAGLNSKLDTTEIRSMEPEITSEK